jgi:hypothetical protein
MIFILHSNAFRFSTRRAFNQVEVLYNCILEEIRDSNPSFFEKLSSFTFREQLTWPLANSSFSSAIDESLTEEQLILHEKEDSLNLCISLECAKKIPNLALEDICFPWNTLENLKGHLVSDPPSKSKQKFLIIIGFLTEHSCFTHSEKSFSEIIRVVLCKVVAYFGSNRSEQLPFVSEKQKVYPSDQEENLSSSPPSSPREHLCDDVNKLLSSHRKKSNTKAKPCKVKGRKERSTSFDRQKVVYSSYPDASSTIATKLHVSPTPWNCRRGGDVDEFTVNPFLYEDVADPSYYYRQNFYDTSNDSLNASSGITSNASHQLTVSASSSHDFHLSSDSWDSTNSANYFHLSMDFEDGDPAFIQPSSQECPDFQNWNQPNDPPTLPSDCFRQSAPETETTDRNFAMFEYPKDQFCASYESNNTGTERICVRESSLYPLMIAEFRFPPYFRPLEVPFSAPNTLLEPRAMSPPFSTAFPGVPQFYSYSTDSVPAPVFHISRPEFLGNQCVSPDHSGI